MGQMIRLVKYDKKCQSCQRITLLRLSQSETSEKFCEFECRQIYFKYVQKNSFLRKKCSIKSGRIVAHENTNVINMAVWKQTA